MVKKNEWPNEPGRRTDEEIKDLARRIVTNEVFITNTDDGIRCAFGVVLAFSDFPQSFAEKIGALYEEYSKAGRMAVNGYPSFFSCSIVNVDDMPKLREEITRYEELLKS